MQLSWFILRLELLYVLLHFWKIFHYNQQITKTCYNNLVLNFLVST